MTASAAAFILFYDALPLFGAVAAIIAWMALRGRVSVQTLGIGWAILLAPYLVMFVMAPGQGLEAAVRRGASTVISPLAGIALAIATVRQRSSRPKQSGDGG